jgi:hypothetical protein
MKSTCCRLLLLFGCILLLAGIGFASACPSATFDHYLGSGFSCGIGDKTFADFAYHSTSNPPGFDVPPGSVSVEPITTSGNPGFEFTAAWMASNASGILTQDSLIEYNVNDGGHNSITDVSLGIGGVGFSGTGSIFVDETICLGATLPSCTGGQIEQLAVYDYSGGVHLFDEVSFAGVSFIDVQKDIEMSSGTDGTARLSLVTNQFSEGTTPEPGSIALFGTGVLALAGVLRRKLIR